MIFNDRRLLGFILLSTGLLYNIQANHIQMTFYIFMMLAIYCLIQFYKGFKSNHLKPFAISMSVLMAAGITGILGNIAHLSTMKDYAEETVRGKTILSHPANQSTQTIKTGLDWDYASEFSNGYLDLVSMIVPGFVGGSSNEKTSPTSSLADDFRDNNKKVSDPFITPLYWGSLPFSSGPVYVGIISFVLCCIGFRYIRNEMKTWAVSSFLILIILSLGHNFFLNKFFFNYVPYFNRFRSLDSILLVAAPIIPWFGIYTLNQLFKNKWKENELKELIKKSAGIFLLSLLALTFLGLLLFNFTHVADSDFWQNEGALIETRKGYMLRETLRSVFIAIVFLAFLYYTLIQKLDKKYFIIGIVLLTLIDLLPIARRCLPERSYLATNDANESLAKSEGNIQILRDRDLHYRVLDRANNTYNDAFASLYHNSIGGYHPAKLRRYQDLIDGYLEKDHAGCINMLNAKYIITKDGKVTLNPDAAGNAWLIDSVITAHHPDEEFALLQNLNIKHQAIILDQEFPGYSGATFTSNGYIKLKEYHPDRLVYNYSASTPQLAVFSEIWYGPNKGWHAYIDHKEVTPIRVNYVLRALKIPEGDHVVEFKFYPDKVWAAIQWNHIILWILSALFFTAALYSFKNKIPFKKIMTKA